MSAMRLKGLYCREVPGDENLIEAAPKGICVECKKPGYFNYLRLQKPKEWELIKEGAIGQALYVFDPLTPTLIITGTNGEYYCPTCYLAFIDPKNFVKELRE